LKGRKLLAKDVKSKPNLDRILKLDICYMDLRTICASLDYFVGLCRNIYAMIQKLGPPTFFVSFSTLEHCWGALINALKHIREKIKSPIENDIEENELETLIRNDPITYV
jgi:hypothetical protein